MLHIIISYLSFLKKSSNHHGLHSPFVYNLVTRCFYDKTKYLQHFALNNCPKTVLTKDYTKHSKKRIQLLFRVIQYFKPNSILEIGSSYGLLTSAAAFVNTKITTFENYLINEQLSKDFYQLIVFNKTISNKESLDYFEKLLITTTNSSVWIFNGIHQSAETKKTWETIKNHPKIKVTIDTFQWGFVFFRAEQEKEHFVIRV